MAYVPVVVNDMKLVSLMLKVNVNMNLSEELHNTLNPCDEYIINENEKIAPQCPTNYF